MIKALGWMIKLYFEIAMGSAFLLMLLGSNKNPNWPGPIGDMFLNAIFVTFFVVSSGYLFSTFWLCVIKRPSKIYNRYGLGILFFTAHLFLFSFFTKISYDVLLPSLAASLVIIFVSTMMESLISKIFAVRNHSSGSAR